MSFNFVVLDDSKVGEHGATLRAGNPLVGDELVPVEGVGVAVELGGIAKRFVAIVATLHALSPRAVTFFMSTSLVLIQHFVRRPQFFALEN
jgi:hypothetical protein